MRDKTITAGTVIRFLLADPSLLTLLGSNLLTLVIAVVENWRILDVMWIYWGQSVTIGWFSWLRMRQLKLFSSEGFAINGAPVPITSAGARMAANNLLAAHAMFHLVYLGFLIGFTSESSFRHSRQDQIALAVCVVSFVINHWFSYRHNLKDDLARIPNIGNIGCMPLIRIGPMHLMIIVCGGLSFVFGETSRLYSAISLIIFLGLKTTADLFMHVVEHYSTNGDKHTPAA